LFHRDGTSLANKNSDFHEIFEILLSVTNRPDKNRIFNAQLDTQKKMSVKGYHRRRLNRYPVNKMGAKCFNRDKYGPNFEMKHKKTKKR